jgi:hypothetical protein
MLNVWRKDGMGRTALDWAEEKWKEELQVQVKSGGEDAAGDVSEKSSTWEVLVQLRGAWPPPAWALEELEQEAKAEEERQAQRNQMREAKKREKAEEAERTKQGLGVSGDGPTKAAATLMTYDGLEDEKRATNRRTHISDPEPVAADSATKSGGVSDGTEFLWGIELCNEEDSMWYDGKATAYSADSDEITIDIESQGLEGKVPLDFSYLRLVACGDEHSKVLFAQLIDKQRAWVQGQGAS